MNGRRFAAITAVAALLTSSLVMLTGQPAEAAGIAPGVEAAPTQTYIAGEDLTLSLEFTGITGAGPQFNLSFGAVLSQDVSIVKTGSLMGTPRTYPAGTVLSPAIVAGTTPNTCAGLGLEQVQNQSVGTCQVPAGKQYLVFQNLSDLPEGATIKDLLTLRPKADTFPAGSRIEYQINGYTNSNQRMLPVFPGSTGISDEAAKAGTSNAGVRAESAMVNALRIDKVEPSPENELLRGVHQNPTTYTLKVWHTGENNITGTQVVDYIPAGLEYLGLGGVDNTRTNANGTRPDRTEYDGSGLLDGTAAPGTTWAHGAGERVETVTATAAEAAQYGVTAGAVYTKVTWDLGTLLAQGDSRGTHTGVKQVYSGQAGTPGLIEIRYRAAVPLFENTMSFGYTPNVTGEQIANLDNNRGASTRHGSADLTSRAAGAKHYTNVATASGIYQGKTVSDADSETIDAVDVRILKDVDAEGFKQGNLARYTLNLATSEYTSAELLDTTSTDPQIKPLRLVDDMGSGLCPVFGPGTQLYGGTAYPNLVKGNYNVSGGTIEAGMTPADWNALLIAAGVDSECQWGTGSSNGASSASLLSGAALAGIAFDPATGGFSVEYALDAAALNTPNARHAVTYTVYQNTRYVVDEGEGATTSMDTFRNFAEINARTTPRNELKDVTSSSGARADTGAWNAWDDSEEWVRAGDTKLEKKVLERSAGVPLPENVYKPKADGGADEGAWVKSAGEPFAVGDQAWYRILIKPPYGADVRNPVFTDLLPEGVEFDLTSKNADGRYTDMWIVPQGWQTGSLPGIGTCQYTSAQMIEWLNTFVPNSGITMSGKLLTFNLGAAGSVCGVGGNDRFLPFEQPLEIYLKVTVTDPSAFAKVDIPENLAKFQYQNVEGEVFALRDAAEVEADRTPKLIKGVRSVNGLPAGGNAFGSNKDNVKVKQSDEVNFRLDITAPYTKTNDYTVYDVLPVGIKAADIKAGSYTAKLVDAGAEGANATFTAQAYDNPTDLPATLKAAYAGRSLIVWKISSTIPGSSKAVQDGAAAVDRGVTLGYTVVVPNGTAGGGAEALANQRYTNDASIVRFDVEGNAADSASPSGSHESTVYPSGTKNVATPPITKNDIPGSLFLFADEANDTSDPSDVYLGDASFAKTLVSTEIGPNTAPNPPGGDHALDTNNPDDTVVQGEYATFQLEVTIPAGTSVRKGVLKDDGLLKWTGNPNVNGRQLPYHLAEATVWNLPGAITNGSGALPPGWTFDPATAQLIFPEYYQNTTAADQKIQLRVRVWIDARDESHPSASSYPAFTHDQALTNTGRFSSKNAADVSNTDKTGSASVKYREPSPTLTKTVTNPANGIVGADGNVTFTLAAANAAGRPTLFDAVVYDCLPAGFSFVEASPSTDVTTSTGCKVTGTGASTRVEADNAGTGTLITWNAGRLDGGAAAKTLQVIAKVDGAAGAGSGYTNKAELVGFTLPSAGLTDTPARRGDRAVGGEAAVRLDEASIDKSVNKPSVPVGETVRYTITTTLPAHANFYDVTFKDQLPIGVTYAGNHAVSFTGWTANPTVGEPSVSGRDLTWTLPQDIALHTQTRTITVSFDAVVTSGVTAAKPLNNATFTWNQVKGNNGTQKSKTDDAEVTLLNPQLDVVKKVDGQDSIERNPDASFDYTITVTNKGQSPAHRFTVVDKVPANVIVDPSSISTVDGVVGVLEGATGNGGGTITWKDVPGPLQQASGSDGSMRKSIEMTYRGRFASAENLAAGDRYENVVDVTKYESFSSGGWVYQPNTPGKGNPGLPGVLIPRVSDQADVKPLFPNVVPVKTVTVPESGQNYGVAVAGQPFGWTLTVTNQGQGIAQNVSVTDTLPENWSYRPGSARINGVALSDPTVSGQKLLWSEAQLRTAGVTPLASRASFAITFEAIPSEAALTAPGTGIGNIQHVHRNTLGVTATDTRNDDRNKAGDYIGADDTADAFMAEANLLLTKDAVGGTRNGLYGLPAGSWVPGAAVGADYQQPQWRITVTNQGPDAAFGPLTFTDTTTLPVGVTTGEWSARYYSGPSDTVGTSLPLTPTADGFTVGTAASSLKANGSDRIVVSANVTVAPGAVASGSELDNAASVVGRTYESQANIDRDNSDDASKALSPVADLRIVKEFAPVAGPRNAGDGIAWSMVVTGGGPANSVSSAAKPIVVTDAVPTSIQNVSQLGGTTLPDGWTLVLTGNTITLTLDPGRSLGVGESVRFDFSGTLSSSMSEGVTITNTGSVAPGDTPDPNGSNNTDDASTGAIEKTTTVDAAKQRVKLDNGVWVDATADSMTAGTELSYRLTMVNTGGADAEDITLTDSLPEYLQYVRWAPETPANGWHESRAGQSLTYTNDHDLAPGARASVIVTVKVKEDHTEAAVNTVCVTASNMTNTNACATDNTSSVKLVDWELEKSHSVPASGSVTAGETVRYVLKVHNRGPSSSDGPITVSDVLPLGLTYAGNPVVTGQGTAGAPALTTNAEHRQVVTWTVNGPLATGTDTVTIAFDATVSAHAVPGTYLNEANVVGVTGEPGDDPANNRDDDQIAVVRQAAMTITKNVEAGPWVAGTDVEYTLSIRNSGPSEAPARVTDTLPAGLTMVSMSGTGWDCSTVVAGSANGTCTYTANDALHPVGDTSIVVTAHISSGAVNLPQPLTNDATLSWTDSVGSHTDTDDEDITVSRVADLGVVKTAYDAAGNETTVAVAGKSLFYGVIVHNAGPSDAIAPIVVTDVLPDGTRFLGLTGEAARAWTAHVEDGTQNVTFTSTSDVLAIRAGESAEIRYEVSVDPALETGASLRNVATMSADTLVSNGDPVTGPEESDEDDAVVTVERRIDLGVVKSHDADAVRIGDTLPFTISVTNYGPAEGSGIVITDTIPAGLEVTSVAGPVLDAGGQPTGWEITSITLADDADAAGGATIVAAYAPTLSPGQTASPLVIDTLVTVDAYASVTNVVTVTGNEPEIAPDEYPNRADDIVNVPPMTDLTIDKAAVGSFQVGEVAEYSITVTNKGPTAAPGPITVVDPLPKGLTFVSSPDKNVTVKGNEVTWTIDGVDVGETVTLTVMVRLGQEAFPSITNEAFLISPWERVATDPPVDNATVEVKAAKPGSLAHPGAPLTLTGADVAALFVYALTMVGLGAAVIAGKKRRGQR